MNELSLLQLVRVKGLLSAQSAATALAVNEETVSALFKQFEEKQWLASLPIGWRLTPEGRAATADKIQAERAGLDNPALTAVYEEFCVLNQVLKATISGWQICADGSANDHSDQAYDATIISQLEQLHKDAIPVVTKIANLAPRLEHYLPRLTYALQAILVGDTTYMAKPIMDSYHTVWFELHEDLMAVTGLTRAEEAAAGRAQ